jgi:hypothetical protein
MSIGVNNWGICALPLNIIKREYTNEEEDNC